MEGGNEFKNHLRSCDPLFCRFIDVRRAGGVEVDEDTIRRIEECNAWMVIKNVEEDSEYRRFIEGCLADPTDMVDG